MVVSLKALLVDKQLTTCISESIHKDNWLIRIH